MKKTRQRDWFRGNVESPGMYLFVPLMFLFLFSGLFFLSFTPILKNTEAPPQSKETVFSGYEVQENRLKPSRSDLWLFPADGSTPYEIMDFRTYPGMALLKDEVDAGCVFSVTTDGRKPSNGAFTVAAISSATTEYISLTTYLSQHKESNSILRTFSGGITLISLIYLLGILITGRWPEKCGYRLVKFFYGKGVNVGTVSEPMRKYKKS